MIEEAKEGTREIEVGLIEGCNVILRRSVYFDDSAPFPRWEVCDMLIASHRGRDLQVPVMSELLHLYYPDEDADLSKTGLEVKTMEEIAASEPIREKMAGHIRKWNNSPVAPVT